MRRTWDLPARDRQLIGIGGLISPQSATAVAQHSRYAKAIRAEQRAFLGSMLGLARVRSPAALAGVWRQNDGDHREAVGEEVDVDDEGEGEGNEAVHRSRASGPPGSVSRSRTGNPPH
ncbi:hypothetical protein VTN02DRAFT_2314 [Thermoascus thermophilus]